MSPHEPVAPAIALGIAGAILIATITFALISVRRVKMDVQQYMIGGRSFGTFFLWVLLAGEIYTSFTFLGAAGWAYGFGAPAFYILAYGTCGYVIGYFILPAVWKIGRDRNLLTGPDFFVDRYGSRGFGVAIAIVQFLLLVPYIALQLSGLRTLLTIAGYGAIDSVVAVAAAFVLVSFFVFTAGLRGTAWASIVKDALILGVVLFAGIVIPIQFFGSPAAMFDQLLREHPQMLVLAQGAAPHGTVWYVSTVLLTAIGFYMGPQSISATYSARSEGVIRRNAMLLPLYQLVLLLVFFSGFAALLIVPGLHGANVDQSFLLIVQRYYPPWVLGVVASAGVLAALIPASALILAAAGVISKNVLGDGLGIATSDAARTLATRILVIVVSLLALGFWIAEHERTIVELLLIYYNGITQFAPGLVAALVWRRANLWGVAAGLATGLGLAVYLALGNISVWGLNTGLLALLANAAVLIAISLVTPPGRAGRPATN